MDHLKISTTPLGHCGRSTVVRSCASFENIVGDTDTVARLGGDEFVVALSDTNHDEVASLADEALRSGLSQTYIINNQALHSSPSIGISLFPTDGDSVEALMKNADMAMYRAKSAGRNNYQFFTAAMNTLITERQQIENWPEASAR